ncbi:AAA15 family ATPase/GTPase [Lactobacillus colini]|uniref:AAA15 family ATPase/GTPase n=1 Tax=Lactobacillus colini TaxID=1819254 RepID=A0ABS4MEI2_9LACO|nr:AAA family ATPase [Lactobacillus colini]MBP2058095.1 AAA15 family ATPase/GTPase [Lactobacillus colini]
MLVEFTVENYASFKDRTTLSAETGARLRKLKDTNTFFEKKPALLKSLLLFGPNGSGKSQLINALMTMASHVVNPTHAVTDKLRYNPFLFSDETKSADTFFEIKIETKNKIYTYSLSYNRTL